MNQDKINKTTNYIYRKSKSNIQYKEHCCDFERLEDGCKKWTFNHLQIHLKNHLRFDRPITNYTETEIAEWVHINDYGEFSRIEHLQDVHSDIHTMEIFAKDEFCNEKSICGSIVSLKNIYAC